MYLSPGNLNPTDLVTSLLMEHELRTQLEAERYLSLVTLVSQSDGVHNEVFNVVDQMPSRTVKDYENIVTRLRALPTLINQSIEMMREQLAAGLAQPAIVVDLTLDQVAAQIGGLPAGDKPLAKLTPRQRQVLQLIAKGYRMREIANALQVSPRTVETHKYEIMRVLGFKNTADLVRYATWLGLVNT